MWGCIHDLGVHDVVVHDVRVHDVGVHSCGDCAIIVGCMMWVCIHVGIHHHH